MNLNQLREDFQLLTDWEDRYAYIIELGETLPPMPEDLKTDANKVEGCTSQVWLVAAREGEVFNFLVDSDAHIVRGLLAVTMLLFNHKTAKEIAATNADQIFAELGLDKHISPNRRNGLTAVVKTIKAVAN